MKIFTCSACKHLAFFENSQCTRCGHMLAFLSDVRVLSAMELSADNAPGNPLPIYVALDPAAESVRYRLCNNYMTHGVCNWAIPEHDPNQFCRACQLNEVIPDLSNPDARDSWQRMEIAKRRLVFTLLELGLPLETKQQNPEGGLAFAFKSDDFEGAEKVLTGHCDGLVTINLKEADAPSREKTRVTLGERYRTLLGHFRHESGHYYWDRLIKDGPQLEAYRALFGNEQEDYAEAVKRHYAAPRQDWTDDFVSSYATMHPWEDWAETWAHYLHILDTLETAQSFGLALKPEAVGGASSELVSARRVHLENFEALIAAWVPLTVAVNSLNRSMGLPDLYPFVLGDRVIKKLSFVHEVVEAARTGQPATPQRTDDREPGEAMKDAAQLDDAQMDEDQMGDVPVNAA
ncbi:MAG: putative zinc-binding metallopeptidase [Myxococcales bacterium]